MTYRQLQAALKYARIWGQIESTFRLNQKKEILEAKYNELQSATPAVKETPKPQPINIQSEIRRAYLQASNGELNARIQFSVIRPYLTHISRSELDKTFIDLALNGTATILQEDDPWAVKQADRDAALMAGGIPNHLIYLRA